MFRASFWMKLVLIAGLGVFAAFAWLSLPVPPRPVGEASGHAHTAGSVSLAEGVVAVDRAAFQVGEPALLEQVNAGDKVKFHADVASGGAFTVTRIERAAQ